MNMSLAVSILGLTATRHTTQNMVLALSTMIYANTPKDKERLSAGRYVLRRWSEYQEVCKNRIENNA